MDANQNGVFIPTHQATMGLRFVERHVDAVELGANITRKVRILQQLFAPRDYATHEVEWRDVPLSEE